jgi:hypothetical protein
MEVVRSIRGEDPSRDVGMKSSFRRSRLGIEKILELFEERFVSRQDRLVVEFGELPKELRLGIG